MTTKHRKSDFAKAWKRLPERKSYTASTAQNTAQRRPGKAANEQQSYVLRRRSGSSAEFPQGDGPGAWLEAPLEPDVRAVVVGFDPHFSYMKLTKAVRYLQQPDCLLVGTNMDNRLPLENGRFIAGTGCLVRAVEMAAQRQADIIGKPSRFIFDCVSQEYGIHPERTVMVGDRLDTDILLGVTCGLKTILTLTGVSSLRDVKSNQESDCMAKKKMVPDFYVDSIADLLPALQG
nr:PREDICTED: phosphoglycolate phosphatase [Bos mutus]